MWNAIKTGLSLLPLIVELIKAIELPGNGEEKKQTVISLALEAIKGLAPDLLKDLDLDKLRSYLSAAIDIIVALFNRTGIFKKSE